MKRTLFLALLLSVTASAFAVEAKINGLWYYLVSKTKEATVIQYKNDIQYSGNIWIPSTVEYEGEEYSVTSIKGSAFRDCTGLTFVLIPGSVTSIGNGAFWGYSGLTSITIPYGVKNIGADAFYHCNNLTSISIPNSVTTIGSQAFLYCSGLTTITMGSGIETIGSEAFAYCPNLTDVYCHAEMVPRAEGPSNAFYESKIEKTTLHVLSASIYDYSNIWCLNYGWVFNPVVGIDGDMPETPKCTTPTISVVGGELAFSCETEDVEYQWIVAVADATMGNSSKVNLTGKYIVSVYAMKEGYYNSDVATKEFTLGAGGDICDVNKDGAVNVADIDTIIDRMGGEVI